jgi:hypothetical protein
MVSIAFQVSKSRLDILDQHKKIKENLLASSILTELPVPFQFWGLTSLKMVPRQWFSPSLKLTVIGQFTVNLVEFIRKTNEIFP